MHYRSFKLTLRYGTTDTPRRHYRYTDVAPRTFILIFDVFPKHGVTNQVAKVTFFLPTAVDITLKKYVGLTYDLIERLLHNFPHFFDISQNAGILLKKR